MVEVYLEDVDVEDGSVEDKEGTEEDTSGDTIASDNSNDEENSENSKNSENSENSEKEAENSEDLQTIRLLCSAWADLHRIPQSGDPLRCALGETLCVHPEDVDKFHSILSPITPGRVFPPQRLCVVDTPEREDVLDTPVTSVTLETYSVEAKAVLDVAGRHDTLLLLSTALSGGYLMRGAVLNIPSCGGVFTVTELSGPGVTRNPEMIYRVSHRTVFRVNVREAPAEEVEGCGGPEGCEAAPPCYEAVAALFRAGKGLLQPRTPLAVLLHGVAGVGKTHFVESLKGIGCDVVKLRCAEAGDAAVSMVLKMLNNETATTKQILLLDDVDRIPRDAPRCALLCHFLETAPASLTIFSTASSLSSVPPLLRAPQRLGREIYIAPPNEEQRAEVARRIFAGSIAEGAAEKVAGKTPGHVQADVRQICGEVVKACGNGEELDRAVDSAVSHHAATLHRSAMTQLATQTSFDAIGGLESVKVQLTQCLLFPDLHPEAAERFQIKTAGGVLLYGPPGCAKTSLVQAIAGQAKRTLLRVDAAGLFACYVGESEATLRAVFATARLLAPSIVFIDELESVCGRRREGNDNVTSTVLTTLLNELDGVDTVAQRSGNATRDVVFIGATNFPQVLDSAVLRPGRLDRLIYVGAPDADDRRALINLFVKGPPLQEALLQHIVHSTEDFTGADLKGLVEEAGYAAIRRVMRGVEGVEAEGGVCLTQGDFDAALRRVKPSASAEVLQIFADFEKNVGK